MVHAVCAGQSTLLGFDLARVRSVSFEHLCIVCLLVLYRVRQNKISQRNITVIVIVAADTDVLSLLIKFSV